jgi:hypothetical protein|tara:strand:+ start:966 stop:1775 length:810 start_codon:yes stop_codon:yes gene_type:complete
MNNKIYKTTDYSQFKFIKGNRPVDPKHVKKLVKSMRKGHVPMPIVVSEKNIIFPCYFVNDGQHRLKAAEICNYPVYYMIVPTMSLEQIRDINQVDKKWTNDDFLDSNVSTEMDATGPYHTFDWFKKKYGFSFQVNIDLLCNIPLGRTSQRVFRDGHITINNLPDAIAKANFLTSLKEYTDLYKNERFMMGMVMVMRQPIWDAERFIRQVRKHASELQHPQRTAALYVEVFNFIFNRGVGRHEKAYFNVIQQGNGAYIKPNLGVVLNSGH